MFFHNIKYLFFTHESLTHKCDKKLLKERHKKVVANYSVNCEAKRLGLTRPANLLLT